MISLTSKNGDKTPTSVFCLVFLLVASCSAGHRYEAIDSNGQVYRIDRQSGQIASVSGDRLVVLPEVTGSPVPASDAYTLAGKMHSWDELDLPAFKQTTHLSIKTKWKDGQLYYRVRCAPFAKGLKEAFDKGNLGNRGFTVNFSDVDGFTLLQQGVTLQQMTRVVDDKGQVSSLEADGNVSCSFERYRDIASVNSSWRD